MRFHRPRPLTTRPSVSVVIPCYNYGRYLPAAVASALDQPGVDLEVIVVDDCSTDDSAAVASDLSAADPRVRLIRHAVNRGHIATYNDGLGEATGDYVVLLSADDLLTSGSITRSVALIEAHPEVGLVYGYAETFEDDVPSVDTTTRSWSTWSGDQWLARVCDRGRNLIVNPEALMRRSLLEELGGYDVDHPHAADMKLWMGAASRGGVGRINGPVQALYRDHGGNMHRTRFAGVLTDLRESRRAFEAVLADGLADRRTLEELRRRSRRALAREALGNAGAALAQQSPGSADLAAELAAFALDCDASVASTLRWRQHVRRAGRGIGRRESALTLRANSLVWALRWQRWRRFGT